MKLFASSLRGRDRSSSTSGESREFRQSIRKIGVQGQERLTLVTISIVREQITKGQLSFPLGQQIQLTLLGDLERLLNSRTSIDLLYPSLERSEWGDVHPGP